MGASSWHYTTPFNDDPNVALQQLRKQVFESGRYGDPFITVNVGQQLKGMPITIRLIVIAAKLFYNVTQLLSWVGRGCRSPRSIEEAIALAGESGTHSILDIERCSQSPDFGVAWKFQLANIRRLYGTEQPSFEDVERVGLHAAAENLERWQAVYFPIYENGIPVSLFFVGCSGD